MFGGFKAKRKGLPPALHGNKPSRLPKSYIYLTFWG